MKPEISIKSCLDEGMENLKANFWEYCLIIIILGIFESMSNGQKLNFALLNGGWGYSKFSEGLTISIIALLIKPVFEFGANLLFVRGNRGEPVDLKEIVEGFKSKELYIDIILANILFYSCVFLGFIALILPGFFVLSRLILASFLVMDKDLGPKQAIKASWELTRDYWPMILAMMFLSCVMVFFGLLLFVVGMIPALIWVKGMFASFYQQILDIHEEDFLHALDIEP